MSVSRTAFASHVIHSQVRSRIHSVWGSLWDMYSLGSGRHKSDVVGHLIHRIALTVDARMWYVYAAAEQGVRASLCANNSTITVD